MEPEERKNSSKESKSTLDQNQIQIWGREDEDEMPITMQLWLWSQNISRNCQQTKEEANDE